MSAPAPPETPDAPTPPDVVAASELGPVSLCAQPELWRPGTTGCPWITADLAPLDATLGDTIEDFQVEEMPAYPASGEGDHYFVEVRKRQIGTPEVAEILAVAAGVHPRDVGFAGRKDVHAVTTQRFSLPAPPVDPGDPRLTLLSVERHRNKLKIGHLRGNRFALRLRLTDATQVHTRLPALLARLADGLPNYFGEQRFGRGGSTLRQAEGLLRAPRRRVRDPRFLVSAFQSAVFNRWLGARTTEGLLNTAILGDILRKRETGGLFACEDAVTDAERVASGELDATGPITAPGVWAATGPAGEREAAAAVACGLDEARSTILGRFAAGSRRVSRIVPEALTAELSENDDGAPTLTLRFSLPKGSYATCVLGELLHPATAIRETITSDE